MGDRNGNPTLMFNSINTKLWSEIEKTIGKNKIYSSFLVNATALASSVNKQVLNLITRLINHDYDHNRWNKSNEFDPFIAPKKNILSSLKDERFNRLTLACAITVHHLVDVEEFLRKYGQATNQTACIVRRSLDLNFLKVLYITRALISLQLKEPFLDLLCQQHNVQYADPKFQTNV